MEWTQSFISVIWKRIEGRGEVRESALDLGIVTGVAPEFPCEGELAKFVTHHVLGDENGIEFLAVVDKESVTDELGSDRGAT